MAKIPDIGFNRAMPKSLLFALLQGSSQTQIESQRCKDQQRTVSAFVN